LKAGPNQPPERPAAVGAAEPELSAQGLIEQCLDAAAQLRASDIHVEPQSDKLSVRLRVEGVLKLWREAPLELHLQVIARLKGLARLDPAERRRCQDGRFSYMTKLGLRDCRLSIGPMLDGEKAVVRLMHQDVSELNLKSIGLSEPNLKAYQELLAKPHGLLLHCGPSGSGRTTALYAALNHLSKSWRNIQTIEDPVEGRLAGVNQAQVEPELGQTYASILRSYLRQDCDVILVGDIRDHDTAQLAVQAAHTGHLVLGALNVSSAIGAVARLKELGVAPFFITSSLLGAMGQRLVRRICKMCRRAFQPSPEIQRECHLSPQHQLYQAVGCGQCGKLGYRGRLGIQEVFVVGAAIRESIQNGATEAELYQHAAQSGMLNLFTDGIAKCAAGYTTIEEVYKTIMSEE
jgi:type II secretory ATPase GspE/PulE/Tfp pilus assembly ATPase PilB-like protein